MEIILVMGGSFLLCWLADKAFTKLFRSKPQHLSGEAVRLNKLYATGGLILLLLGILAVMMNGGLWLMIAGGCLIMAVGIGLIVYYMSFGVFYDEDGFLLTSFGKKETVYRYCDIQGQLLYNNAGHILIELHMKDARSVHLLDGMTQVDAFMNKAFEGWCRQKGISREDCAFYDPANSCWFPTMEG